MGREGGAKEKGIQLTLISVARIAYVGRNTDKESGK